MPSSFEIGDAAERRVAAIGGRRVPGSGNGKFRKLDVRGLYSLIFSVKASKKITDTGLRAIAKLWREAVDGTRGFDGHGDGARPACAFEIGNDILVLIRLDDLNDIATAESENSLPLSNKAQNRRDRSRRSLLG